MKQILQNLATGETSVEEVPCPMTKSGHALIKTSKSLVSVGTERMLINFGKANWIKKAQSQPDKVREVAAKVKTDGLMATYSAVKTKLDQPLPLGYCNVGVVIDGADTGLKVGTRVISNGNHAEVVRVPKNLIAEVPDGVSDEAASFTVLGAIALQGVRLLKPTLGETIVVTGLGMIGLLAVQILKANGCRVLGVDFDTKKCELAKSFGIEVVDLSKGESALHAAEAFASGKGVDGVLITANSESNSIISEASMMCRKRGRIVLVGVVGLALNRADFYEKELTFQVSCSYGPGRYDDEYEANGNDYPAAYVRWTEQRNFEVVLELLLSGAIDVTALISHNFLIEDAIKAYAKLNDPATLGILLNYSSSEFKSEIANTISIDAGVKYTPVSGKVSFLGSGNYASRTLIPAFKKAGASFGAIVTSTGISAFHHGKKNEFEFASTDINEAFGISVGSVVVATQHNLHAKQVIAALNNGKNVFVEKPLALSYCDIDEIEKAQIKAGRMVMVGYNRRFAPHVRKMKDLLSLKKSPKTFIMTMNAGHIPKDHWTQNKEVGGGRILGEACHYIDLMRFLTGSRISSFTAVKMGENSFVEITEDKAIISLTFEDGSVGSIHYFANGSKKFPKERIEVFCDNGVLQLDNFRSLRGFGWERFNKMNLWMQDKGQKECANAFMVAVKQGLECPIPQNEVYEVSRLSIDIAQQLRN